jgi:cytochrome P450
MVDSIFRTDTAPEEVIRNQKERVQMLRDLVELRTREPGSDLTSALIAARQKDPGGLTEEELIDTIWLLVTAGHETTLSLILNAVRALATHPDQLAIAVAGNRWDDVIEETMRWDAPITNFMARYPLEDIEIAGNTVPAGEAILACYSAAGRDAEHYGEAAGAFSLADTTARHLSFGGGPHFCPGATLARAEAAIAVGGLFTRYPGLTLAAAPDAIPPVPSFFSNSPAVLSVRL